MTKLLTLRRYLAWFFVCLLFRTDSAIKNRFHGCLKKKYPMSLGALAEESSSSSASSPSSSPYRHPVPQVPQSLVQFPTFHPPSQSLTTKPMLSKPHESKFLHQYQQPRESGQFQSAVMATSSSSTSSTSSFSAKMDHASPTSHRRRVSVAIDDLLNNSNSPTTSTLPSVAATSMSMKFLPQIATHFPANSGTLHSHHSQLHRYHFDHSTTSPTPWMFTKI
jgi:hypothetical protein